jgi:hypothetical protein
MKPTLTASETTWLESLPSEVDEYPRFTTSCYAPSLVHEIWSMCRKAGLHSGAYAEKLVGDVLICTLIGHYQKMRPIAVQWIGTRPEELNAPFRPHMFDDEKKLIEMLRLHIMHEALK